jgi:hypothetical protein
MTVFSSITAYYHVGKYKETNMSVSQASLIELLVVIDTVLLLLLFIITTGWIELTLIQNS